MVPLTHFDGRMMLSNGRTTDAPTLTAILAAVRSIKRRASIAASRGSEPKDFSSRAANAGGGRRGDDGRIRVPNPACPSQESSPERESQITRS